MGSNVRMLRGLRMLCTCGVGFRHTPSEGSIRRRKFHGLRVAQAYPRGFSKMIAEACLADCGWGKADKLNLSACSHCGHQRIGEAKNPGPRRSSWFFTGEQAHSISDYFAPWRRSMATFSEMG